MNTTHQSPPTIKPQPHTVKTNSPINSSISIPPTLIPPNAKPTPLSTSPLQGKKASPVARLRSTRAEGKRRFGTHRAIDIKMVTEFRSLARATYPNALYSLLLPPPSPRPQPQTPSSPEKLAKGPPAPAELLTRARAPGERSSFLRSIKKLSPPRQLPARALYLPRKMCSGLGALEGRLRAGLLGANARARRDGCSFRGLIF